MSIGSIVNNAEDSGDRQTPGLNPCPIATMLATLLLLLLLVTPQVQPVHSTVAGVAPAGLPCCAASPCRQLPADAAEGCTACGAALSSLQGELILPNFLNRVFEIKIS